MNQDSLSQWYEKNFDLMVLHFSSDTEASIILQVFQPTSKLLARSVLAKNNSLWSRLKDSVKVRPSLTQIKEIAVPLNKEENVDVLVWPWLKSHASLLVNLVEELRKNAFQTLFYSHNSNFIDNEILDKNEEEKIKIASVRFYDAKSRIVDYASSLEGFKTQKEKIRFDYVFKKSILLFDRFVHTYFLSNYLYDQYKPKILFVGNDITVAGRTASLVASKKGILTAGVQHGSNRSVALKFSVCDYYFVFGKSYKQRLLDIVLKKNIRVYSVGALKFDSYFKPGFKESFPAELQEYAKSNSVIVAFSGPGNSTSIKEHKHNLVALTELMQKMADFSFFIKLHPKDHIQYYKQIDQLTNVTILKGKEAKIPLVEWLKVSQLLITGASASALEAFILKVPVLTLDLFDKLSSTDFIQAGATYHAQSTEALIAQFNTAISSTEVRLNSNRFIESNFANSEISPENKIVDYLRPILLPSSTRHTS